MRVLIALVALVVAGPAFGQRQPTREEQGHHLLSLAAGAEACVPELDWLEREWVRRLTIQGEDLLGQVQPAVIRIIRQTAADMARAAPGTYCFRVASEVARHLRDGAIR